MVIILNAHKKVSWNKGKSVGRKEPLTHEHVQAIRTILHNSTSVTKLRDLALFETGLDSMLRSVDLLSLKIGDVVDFNGTVKSRVLLQQQKTKNNVTVELLHKSQSALRMWIDSTKDYKNNSSYLFTGFRRAKHHAISHQVYRNLIKMLVKSINLDPALYATHTMRRSKASIIYEQTQNVEVVRILLGQKNTSSTSAYLGISDSNALDIAKSVEI